MNASTFTLIPEATASGMGAYAEPSTPAGETHRPDPCDTSTRPPDAAGQILHRVATTEDYHAWLTHVFPAAGCAHPIRLAGEIATVEHDTGRLLSLTRTADLPDGVVYKACGNRRASVCPSCAEVYRRDAYELIRTGLVGGKGVPESVAHHPAVFLTLTAPGFGAVHTHAVTRHTCGNRRRCDCRPAPCHPRRDQPTCPHDQPGYCWARHETDDRRLGQPLCPDCYHYDQQVVWNNAAGELWRRTRINLDRTLTRVARAAGIDGKLVKLRYAKAAEMQRRGVVHYHLVIRLDGAHPDLPGLILPPPVAFGVDQLHQVVTDAVAATAYTTRAHPANPAGWHIAWGTQVDIRPIRISGDGDLSDQAAAGYLAKYATKSTEATGHTSRRLDLETLHLYANPAGSHTERIIHTCWTLGADPDWRTLRRWAHMLGYGGHFLTKARHYSTTFANLRGRRTAWRWAQHATEQQHDHDTTIVVNWLTYTGAGWKTAGDALLANTAAAHARERQQAARDARAESAI